MKLILNIIAVLGCFHLKKYLGLLLTSFEIKVNHEKYCNSNIQKLENIEINILKNI